MKLLLLSIIPFAAATPILGGSQHVNSHHWITKLNSEHDTWRAEAQSIWDGMTWKDVQARLGAKLVGDDFNVTDSLPSNSAAVKDVPDAFDARTQWGDLVHPIRNQLQCGSCWAFSASEVLSDRFAIASNKSSPVLSPEDLVSCDKGDMGCQGGMLPAAWKYLTGTGIVTDACFPYTAGGGQAAACPSGSCTGTGSWTKYKAKSAYAMKSVADMQKDIMTNGPIQIAFSVYKSFMSYKSGVYKKKFYELIPEGGHAVKIVGWGVDGGTPYWTVANSWGTSWGMNGFFNILRGKNECGVEKKGPPYAGLPQL